MAEDCSDLEEWLRPLRERAQEMYESLGGAGIRIFVVSVGRNDTRLPWYWIHDSKTTDAWRQDVRNFIDSSETTDEDIESGRADNDVMGALGEHLRVLGYVEVDDVAADVFEGRVTNERARLIHDPAHEEQADGFGHYGWESGRSVQRGA